MKRRNFIGSLAALFAMPLLKKSETPVKFAPVVAPGDDVRSGFSSVEAAPESGLGSDENFTVSSSEGDSSEPGVTQWHNVAYNDGVFMAVNNNRSMKSTDLGLTWVEEKL